MIEFFIGIQIKCDVKVEKNNLKICIKEKILMKKIRIITTVC